MIQSRYLHLFPFNNFTCFQSSCMKEILKSGRDIIVTTKLGVGEQIIPEFGIIRELQSASSKKIIFYVVKDIKLRCKYLVNKYLSCGVNCMKIKEYSQIDHSIPISIYIVKFHSLIKIFQKADNSFLDNIDLVAFEDFSEILFQGLSSEMFFFYLRKNKFRLVGINYSYEIRDRLCKYLLIDDELKEKLTYNGSTNDDFLLIPFNNEFERNEILLNEMKSYLPNNQIILFCSTMSKMFPIAKYINENFPNLLQNEINDDLINVNDKKIQLLLKKGIGVICNNNAKLNQSIFELFSSNSLKVLITDLPFFLQSFNIYKESSIFHKCAFDNCIVFIQGNENLGFFTKSLFKKIIVLLNANRIEQTQKAINGEYSIVLPEGSFISKFILRMIENNSFRSIEDLKNFCLKCFNSQFDFNNSYETLKKYNFIDNVGLNITGLGKIYSYYKIDIDDLIHLKEASSPRTISDTLYFLCTETIALRESNVVNNDDKDKLKKMLLDHKMPFDNQKLLLKLENNDAVITPGEKAYILLQYHSCNDVIDTSFSSDLLKIKEKLSTIIKAYLELTQVKKSYWGMLFSRELKKRIRWNLYNDHSPKLFQQFPNIGSVYGKRIFDSGIQTYTDLVSIKQSDLDKIIPRNSTLILKSIRNLPLISSSYIFNEQKLIITLINHGGFFVQEKKIKDHKIDVIGGNIDTGELIYFNSFNNFFKPIIIEINLLDKENLETIEFSFIDSEYIGPDEKLLINLRSIK